MQLRKKILKKFFFRLSFRNSISCVYNFDDLSSINSSLRSSHTRISYTHNFKNNWNKKKINCNIYIWGLVYGENLLRVKGSLAYPRYPKQVSFSTFPYEQSNKTLARLERLAASPFFDGRVALLAGPTIFRERLSEKVHVTTLKGIVGGFEFTRPQRNLKQWYERYPANSRRISGRRFSPSSPSEREKRRPEIRLLFAGHTRGHGRMFTSAKGKQQK